MSADLGLPAIDLTAAAADDVQLWSVTTIIGAVDTLGAIGGAAA